MQQDIYPELKSTVEFFPMERGLFHVYDGETSRHFKLGAQEVSWLKALDGATAKEQLRGSVIPEEYFDDFFRHLRQMDLIRGSGKREKFNPLKIKFRLFNPDPLLSKYDLLSKIYSVMLFMATPVVVLCNILLIAFWWQRLSTIGINVQLTVPLVLTFYCCAVISGICHEFSHAMVAKAHGVHVPTIGFMFLLFYPAMYADVSGINLLSKRADRVKVLIAGVCSNNLILFLALAVFTMTGSDAVRLYAGVVISVNLTFALYNLLPFIQFDGYFILSELFEERRLVETSYRSILTRQDLRLERILFFGLSNLFMIAIIYLLANGIRTRLLGVIGPLWADLSGILLFGAAMALIFWQRLRDAVAR